MGRAIVRRPQVFLLDEPLSNLDAKLRVQTRTQIASLQRRLGVTTVYVTHDQVEAMTMGDRVAVLDRGVLQQVDTPHRLFTHPANVFVAGFIGSPAMNIHRVPVATASPCSPGMRRTGAARAAAANGDERRARVSAGGARARRRGRGRDRGDGAGSRGARLGRLHPCEPRRTSSRRTPRRDRAYRPDRVPARGSRVRLRVRPDKLHLFSAATGETHYAA